MPILVERACLQQDMKGYPWTHHIVYPAFGRARTTVLICSLRCISLHTSGCFHPLHMSRLWSFHGDPWLIHTYVSMDAYLYFWISVENPQILESVYVHGRIIDECPRVVHDEGRCWRAVVRAEGRGSGSSCGQSKRDLQRLVEIVWATWRAAWPIKKK